VHSSASGRRQRATRLQRAEELRQLRQRVADAPALQPPAGVVLDVQKTVANVEVQF